MTKLLTSRLAGTPSVCISNVADDSGEFLDQVGCTQKDANERVYPAFAGARLESTGKRVLESV